MFWNMQRNEIKKTSMHKIRIIMVKGVSKMRQQNNENKKEKAYKSTEGNQAYPEYNDRENKSMNKNEKRQK